MPKPAPVASVLLETDPRQVPLWQQLKETEDELALLLGPYQVPERRESHPNLASLADQVRGVLGSVVEIVGDSYRRGSVRQLHVDLWLALGLLEHLCHLARLTKEEDGRLSLALTGRLGRCRSLVRLIAIEWDHERWGRCGGGE